MFRNNRALFGTTDFWSVDSVPSEWASRSFPQSGALSCSCGKARGCPVGLIAELVFWRVPPSVSPPQAALRHACEFTCPSQALQVSLTPVLLRVSPHNASWLVDRERRVPRLSGEKVDSLKSLGLGRREGKSAQSQTVWILASRRGSRVAPWLHAECGDGLCESLAGWRRTLT